MATTNVLVNRTGTNWTVDVTPCDLDPDINIKDFVALIAGSVVPTTSFNKTTSTTLTYVGASLPSNTQVEIRRKTPNLAKSMALLGSRVRSSDWNSEFDRVYRHFEEYDLNGAGSPTQTALPKNDAFGAIWDGDNVYPPTRNAVYDYLVLLAPLISPAFTGNPTVPTQLTTDSSNRIASTAYVKNNLVAYAALASPAFTGSPTVPTALATDNSTIIANTAWVRALVSSSLSDYVTSTALTSLISAYAPLNSPALTGNPTAPTPSTIDVTGNNVVTQAYVHTSERPFLDVTRVTTAQTFANNTFTQVVFNNEITDTAGMYNPTTGNIVIPAGLGGTFQVNGFITLDASVSVLVLEVFINGSSTRRVGQVESGSGISFNGVFNASAGQTVTLQLYQVNGGGTSRANFLGTSLNWMTLHRVNV